MNETFHPPPPEAESLPKLKIVLVATAALVLFSAATLIAWWMSLAWGSQSAVPPAIGSARIGAIEQQPFEVVPAAQARRAQELERLKSFGWVNRDAGLVRIPIELAIERLVHGQRAEEPAP